jgi:hypothetical protein
LQAPTEQKPAVATAQDPEVAYGTPEFKQGLERVLHACGQAKVEQRRGCKPSDIKAFAAISDEDFNALFHPLRERGGVLLFDDGFDKLDEPAKELLDERWTERKGARYFFVVARLSSGMLTSSTGITSSSSSAPGGSERKISDIRFFG